MEELIKQVLQEVKQINNQIDNLEQKIDVGFEAVHKKLDIIQTQVAHNTEQLTEIASIVQEHDTDIKIIKKAI